MAGLNVSRLSLVRAVLSCEMASGAGLGLLSSVMLMVEVEEVMLEAERFLLCPRLCPP